MSFGPTPSSIPTQSDLPSPTPTPVTNSDYPLPSYPSYVLSLLITGIVVCIILIALMVAFIIFIQAKMRDHDVYATNDAPEDPDAVGKVSIKGVYRVKDEPKYLMRH